MKHFLAFGFVITFGLVCIGQAYSLSEKGEEINVNMGRQLCFIEKNVHESAYAEKKCLHLNKLIEKDEYPLAHQLIKIDNRSAKGRQGL